ncbi:MAG TPA: cytochrome c [Steroidobacteraceae bacterium]|nr:cytochrome c [Steroidobacteraceae bacterium]
MKRALIVLAALAVVALGVVIARTPPSADQNAVEYRQALMFVIDGQMQALSSMHAGRMPYDAALVREHAADLTTLAGMIPEAFSRDTRAARRLDTAALAYVWTDQAHFVQSARRLQRDAEALNGAVQDGDEAQVQSAIGALSGECVQCHRQYRGN